MLTDFQLEQLAQRMKIPLEGVYFKDEMPKPIKTNVSYIINLQDSETEDGEQNSGTHWTLLQINETPKGDILPFYFDSYGAPPPEVIKNIVKKQFNKYLPYSNKDIQSLMNEACGYYCLAFSYFVNTYKDRTNNFYADADIFLDLFDDLSKSVDFMKNEFILKHFFLSEDPKTRMKVDVFNRETPEYNRIVNDTGDRPNIEKIPVQMNIMDNK